jgi:hypothetical protein
LQIYRETPGGQQSLNGLPSGCKGSSARARDWTVVDFGKYEGKTLPQIVLIDPDWFFWAVEEHIFNKSDELKAEANEIRRKATNIKIPSGSRVEYAIHPSAGELASVSVVPASTPQHHGSSPTLVAEVLDLSMARKIAPYDKLGGGIIVAAVKFHVLDGRKTRLTRERCERFFNDDTNFAL